MFSPFFPVSSSPSAPPARDWPGTARRTPHFSESQSRVVKLWCFLPISSPFCLPSIPTGSSLALVTGLYLNINEPFLLHGRILYCGLRGRGRTHFALRPSSFSSPRNQSPDPLCALIQSITRGYFQQAGGQNQRVPDRDRS